VYGRTDRLVPMPFVERLAGALPPGSAVWETPAGHCHHEDEPEKVLAAEYRRRWEDFFRRHLPVEVVGGGS
jgi:pimeloyl-ACP methyl ester carboxylesterase